MARFVNLTKYIDVLENDNLGEWFIDTKSKGTLEDPRHFPFVNYSDIVMQFENEVYDFVDSNKDIGLNLYNEILEKNGIEWTASSMTDADVSALDAQCTMALLVGAIRAERFCDGALLSFFKNGCIKKWLHRLKQLDES